MQRDDPDRSGRGEREQRDPWQTGNRRRARRADEDPATGRHAGPDAGDEGRYGPPPDDPGPTRRTRDPRTGPPGGPGAPGPGDDPRAPGPGGDPGATREWVGPGPTRQHGDPGATGQHGDPGATGQYGDPGATGQYGDPGATGQYGDRGPTRQLGDPGATGQYGDLGATRRVGDPGATRQVGDPGATRRVGDPGAARQFGGPRPGQDPGATRNLGAPVDGGPTRHVGPGDPGGFDRTRQIGGPARAPRPDATRMLPEPVGGPELLGGRYRLEGLIGQGGMADVHRATDTRLNRAVAVKIFGPGNDPAADQRFRQEAQVMANLRHPGLVGVHDFAVEPDRAYLVMELVDGPTLREVIESEQLPADDIRRIGLEVAQTLDYVHGQGVTHRDVKPSNILIGSDGRARLADFGVASLLGADGHTGAGEIVGTPAYLAPEQVRGGEVGPPADVYALGLVLLEAWTGRREYQGDGLGGASERLTRAPVIPRDLPEPLRGAITAMTETDPGRRPDAREAAEMLADEGPAPTPPPPDDSDVEQGGGDLGSSRSGRWIAIGAFVVVLLVLLIGLLIYNTRGSDTTPAAPSSTSERTTTSERPTTSERSTEPTTTSRRPSSENDGPGFTLPSNIPTELPSGIRDLPSNLPSPNQVGNDARGFWDDIRDWWNNLF